ncbi:hypothetical protein [Sandaracinus amylolyticus]|uniref:Uncharacterized protein n=1 Tax=Sandaracinus amylolyticus TaxID=927083 RepID=A0A0F6W805_9BACT|nr:hypothetical protein [Sandaracinus amylolyticus]AKF09665.1 hypothetical protein DB32_006814 [Sandaracinus amylolyticus]
MRDERTPPPVRHDALLRALTRAVAPRSIVEIAAPGASGAALLLESAGEPLRSLELVGESSGGVASELRASAGDRVRAREGLSLDEIATLDAAPDLVLIGHDPDWNGIFHALRLLARLAGTAPFPITIVRDTSGVSPEKPELGTGKNGLRVALDEFRAQTAHPLDLVFVPGFHGLAILVDPRRVVGNDALSSLLRELATPPSIRALLDELEQARVDAQLELAALHAKSDRRAAERAELIGRLAEQRRALERTERELAEALERAQRNALRVIEEEAARDSIETRATSLEAALRDAHTRIAELTTANERLAAANARVAERERTLDDLAAQLAAARRRAMSEPLRADVAHTLGRDPSTAKKPGGSQPATPFARALAGAAPKLLEPAVLELASRRLAKLRRDPKLFFAHSRFEIARKLSRLL